MFVGDGLCYHMYPQAQNGLLFEMGPFQYYPCERGLVDIQCPWVCGLLALSIGQRLCVNFYVLIRANFLTTLRSHLNVTCSCNFWKFYLTWMTKSCIPLTTNQLNQLLVGQLSYVIIVVR